MKKIYLRAQRLFLLALAMLLFGTVHAQITVSGTVIDGTYGGGLPGANVVVKGTTTGTATDFDGNYSIEVKDGSAVLEFSSMGYKTITKTVGSQTKIDVVLKEDTKEVEEVVKIGYGVAKKEDVTSAITSVAGSDISDKPVLAADQALQGRASGVQVKTNSGKPGAEMAINIRGFSSLNDGKPLYVVDGVAQDGISGLSPSEIKEMAILKDASACAIYGSRAAYGVIIITTKDGGKLNKEENSVIEFNAYRGVQKVYNRIDVMSAEEYMNYDNHYRYKDDATKSGYWTDEKKAQVGGGVDWQDEVFRPAVLESYQLAFGGSSQKTQYRVSASYFNQEGIIKGSDMKRYTVGVKANHKLKKRLMVEENIGFNVKNSNKINDGGVWTGVLANTVYANPAIDGIYDTTSSADILPYWKANILKNPMEIIESHDWTKEEFGLGGSVWAEYEIINGLKAKVQGSYSVWNNEERDFAHEFYIRSDYNKTPNSLDVTKANGNNWSLSGTLSYEKYLYAKAEDGSNDSSHVKHTFRAMVGTEGNYNYQEGSHDYSEGYELEDKNSQFWELAENRSVKLDSWRYPTEYALASNFFRLEYGFDKYFNINGTYRYDGTSKFSEDNRYGGFAAFGAALKIHEFDFFKNNETLKNINSLKLRVGWGKVGNQATSSEYAYLGTINLNTLSNGKNSLTINEPANPDLKWESSQTWNMGIDMGILRNKIDMSFDVYRKATIDMITRAPIPNIVPTNLSPNINVGDMLNKGVEFSITYHKAEGEFNYNVSGNISVNKNEVTDLGGTKEQPNVLESGYTDHQYVVRSQAGRPLAEFYGYKTDGVYTSWDEINNGPTPIRTDVAPGDLKFVDINHDGKIDANDQTVIGSPHPDFIYGLTFDCAYKGFDFSLAMAGSQGNQNYNYLRRYIDGDENGYNLHTRRLDAWTEENQTSEPRNSGDIRHVEYASDYFIEDASYLRIQSVQLGYTLPQTLMDKVNIDKLRVYVQAQNLFTFTKYSGFDPEVGNNPDQGYDEKGVKGIELGVDRGTYPVGRTFLVGLNLTF